VGRYLRRWLGIEEEIAKMHLILGLQGFPLNALIHFEPEKHAVGLDVVMNLR